MKKLVYTILIFTTIMAISCKNQNKSSQTEENLTEFKILDENIEETIQKIKEKNTDKERFRIEKGVKQVASLWQQKDGDLTDFTNFCIDNFIADSTDLKIAFDKLERNFEILFGHYNKISLKLMEPLHLDMGEISFIDNVMGAYSPQAHLIEDLFENKLAFFVALNFPAYSLTEKTENAEKWSRLEWAYARMGDLFISRVPAGLLQKEAEVLTNADTYIADYNIYMENLVNSEQKTFFPKDMKLITHWGLRDELKSNYQANNGLEKQIIIYNVMLRIINQDIPIEVINKNDFTWDPIANKIYKDGKETSFTKENYTRYEHLLYVFKALSAMDKYNPVYPSYIERAYDQEMEISRKEIEELFVNFISSPEIKDLAKLIEKRLNRSLEPFDIWYNGFKARTNINEEELDQITRRKYPNTSAFEKDIARILVDLGWNRDKANYIANKISVDASRGAGHAWGAQMKGDQAHLRTRIGNKGMDYKAYNIAIHELGHNVEQTISLYDMDYYMLTGVPNTAFTEACAFLFQSKDLKLLGKESHNKNQETEALAALDNCWSAFEIMGVSLLDMYVWQWMYENPDANPQELKEAVVNLAIDVWNKYYYPVMGVKDSPILAIYSHSITSPLYLANYPAGHLIEFQIEQYLNDKNFAEEFTRVLLQGKITPQAWMKGAVGSEISGQTTLEAVRKALVIIK